MLESGMPSSPSSVADPMTVKRRTLVGVALLAIPVVANAQICKGERWADNFQDLSKWTFGGGGPLSDGNGGFASYQAPYHNSAETIGPNGLTIGIQPANAPNGAAWEAGLIKTLETYTLTYGVVQFVVDVPSSIEQRGMSWAGWMLGTQMVPGSQQGWPFELDVAEMYGPTFDSAMHSGFTADSAANNVYNLQTGVHTFTVAWFPDTITWYMDKMQTKQTQTPADGHGPMFLIIGTAATNATGWTNAPQPGTSGSVNVRRVSVFDTVEDANACGYDQLLSYSGSANVAYQQSPEEIHLSSAAQDNATAFSAVDIPTIDTQPAPPSPPSLPKKASQPVNPAPSISIGGESDAWALYPFK
jgi:beta-glucanase (GH16 family)